MSTQIYVIMGVAAIGLYMLTRKTDPGSSGTTNDSHSIVKDQIANARHSLLSRGNLNHHMRNIDSRAVFPSELTTHLE